MNQNRYEFNFDHLNELIEQRLTELNNQFQN